MPKETFSHTALTRAARTEVWKALDRPETWEGIGGVDKVIAPVIDNDDRLRGFSFETAVGGKIYLGKATPKAREESRLMAWTIENSEVRGVTTVQISDDGPGTRVQVTLEVESVGMLASMFFPVIANAIGSGLPQTVDAFAAGFDPGPRAST